MAKPTCQNCGKPVLPGSRFCSNSCDAGFVMNKGKKRASSPSPAISTLLGKGVISVSVKAVEFSPKPDIRGPGPKNRPTLWEARISDGANGDCVAKREDPDEALRDALASYGTHKKPVKRPEPEDDGMDLI